ncbi:MAG: hypothetical protein EBT73_01045 [Actinobacteria bacterium]|nr:hypothetical protein [Actinomycetota bacterium]
MASLGEVLARVDASEVARGDFRVSGATNVDISDVTHDSRTVQRGSLFCCVPGEQRDGHDFAVEAAQAGATALLVEREVPGAHVTQVVVRDVRRSMGYVSAAFHQHPSRALTVVGANARACSARSRALAPHQRRPSCSARWHTNAQKARRPW